MYRPNDARFGFARWWFGAAPDCGEVVLKSFLLAHEPDW